MKTLILIVVFVSSMCSAYTQQVTREYKVGDKLEVYDPIEKNWFKSTILKAEKSRWFIHYEGYDAKWDTWVDATRIRGIGEKKDLPFFYLIGSSEKLYHFYTDESISVTSLSPDTLAYTSKSDLYTFKKLSNFPFMEGKRKVYESKLYAYWLDNNSFLVSRSNESVSYYNRDKETGTSKMNDKSINKDIDSLLAQVGRMEKQQKERENIALQKQKAQQEKENKIKLTEYARTIKSRRSDPVLEKKIFEWWNAHNPEFPALKVFFLDPDFSLPRDGYNQVLRKSIAAMVVYKGKQGTCWMQWNSFGYEHLGGGAFNDELGAWTSGHAFRIADIDIYPGTNYELDCTGLK